MVKENKSNGHIKSIKLGGFAKNIVESEGVPVFSSDGNKIFGSLMQRKSY